MSSQIATTSSTMKNKSLIPTQNRLRLAQPPTTKNKKHQTPNTKQQTTNNKKK
jgi:hypothetical protein